MLESDLICLYNDIGDNMLLDINSYCSSPLIGNILVILKNIFNLIMIIAPILAMVFLSIKFIQMFINPDDSKKFQQIANEVC